MIRSLLGSIVFLVCVVIFFSASGIAQTSTTGSGSPVTPPAGISVPGGETTNDTQQDNNRSVYVCGNDICEAGETPSTCPLDCGTCGNGVCNARMNETRLSCPQDCTVCGDTFCDAGETPSTCSADCGTCGNSVCDASETCSSCTSDCGACPTDDSGSSSSSSGGGGGGAGIEFCREAWTCGEWSPCSSGTQSRICTDGHSCGTTKTKPFETQSCVIPPSVAPESEAPAPLKETAPEQTTDTQTEEPAVEGNAPSVTGQVTAGGVSNGAWFLIALAVVGVVGILGVKRRMRPQPKVAA